MIVQARAFLVSDAQNTTAAGEGAVLGEEKALLV